MNHKIDWHYHLSGRNIKKDVETLKSYIKNENMKEVFVMASYFPENGSGVSNFNVYHHIKDIENTKMYLSLDFENYYFMCLNEIETLLHDSESIKKIMGIKIYTGYQTIDFSSEKLKNILNLARKFNLKVMFHTGYLKGNKKDFNPLFLEDIIKNNNDITFIIAHLGNPFIDESIYLLKNYDNLYADISGLVDRRIEIKETVKRVQKIADNVISAKILFGTDYPMQDYKTTMIFADVFLSKYTIKATKEEK